MKSAWLKLFPTLTLSLLVTACSGGMQAEIPTPSTGGNPNDGTTQGPAPSPNPQTEPSPSPGQNQPQPPAVPQQPGTQPQPSPQPQPAPSQPGPTPTPVPTPEPTPGPQPTPQPGPTPQPSPLPEPTPVPNPGPQPQPSPGPAPQPEPTPTPVPVPQPVPVPAPQPDPAQCAPESGTAVAGQITINNGESFTSSKNVVLKLERHETLRMKISNNGNCGCGTWEIFSEKKDWTLPLDNKANTISVQFKDYENNSSACTSVTIVHDSLAPSIDLKLDASNNYNTGSTTKVQMQVLDNGSGVKTVSCSLNGTATSCSAGNSVLSFPNPSAGTYKFSVSSIDQLGHSSSKEISWVVKIPYQEITQTHEVKSNKKVDILLIDDNSVSMQYEQQNMAKRMSTFLNQLAGLEWQIAITTTDPEHQVWGDGRLLEMRGLPQLQHVISSAMEPTLARSALEKTIQRSESGSGYEQGIFATYRAIERSLSSDPKDAPHKQFFRNDANFAAVVISDENETGTAFKNIPENLLNFVKSTWPSKNFAFHSIITRPGDTKCRETYGYDYGTVYEKMSLLTGAGMIGGPIIGSVCEEDYGSQLRGIGDSVQAMQKVINLQCPPIGNANSAVVVLLNGSNYTDSYQIQGTRMIFNSNLPVGTYTLQYKCQ